MGCFLLWKEFFLNSSFEDKCKCLLRDPVPGLDGTQDARVQASHQHNVPTEEPFTVM